MKMLKILALALVLLGAGFAITPVFDWTAGPQDKMTPGSEGDFVTEGGNITEVNLTSNQSTEKWAGIYGNIVGTLTLATSGANTFYSWTISNVDGSKVCAGTDSSAFTWSAVTSAAEGTIDSIWSFTAGDIDSVTSTYSDPLAGCNNFKVAGKTTATTAGVANVGGSGDFTNCALGDGGNTVKGDFVFCTIAAEGTQILDDTVSAAYALMLPTNEQDGQTETYDLFVELA